MRALRDLLTAPNWWQPFAAAWTLLTILYIVLDGASGLLAGAITATVGMVVVYLLRRAMLRR